MPKFAPRRPHNPVRPARQSSRHSTTLQTQSCEITRSMATCRFASSGAEPARSAAYVHAGWRSTQIGGHVWRTCQTQICWRSKKRRQGELASSKFAIHGKQRCKLFDSLVLPILGYASEVWAVDDEEGNSAEQLHRVFLKHVLGVRAKILNNTIVLAEFGRYPLRFHW